MATFFEESSGLLCKITHIGANYVLFIDGEKVFESPLSPENIIQHMKYARQLGHEKWDAHYPAPGQGYRFVPDFDKWKPE